MTPAWLAGYTGIGISICIVDDGIDHPHPDLVDHYVSLLLMIFVLFCDRKKNLEFLYTNSDLI